MPSRGTAQRDRKNGAAKRCYAHFVQPASAHARPPALSRDRATGNPRTVIHRRFAAKRNNAPAHSSRRRSGASRAVNVEGDVTITAELERSTTTYSSSNQKSRRLALADADFRKRACDRSRIAAGMHLVDELDQHERPV